VNYINWHQTAARPTRQISGFTPYCYEKHTQDVCRVLLICWTS